jgi:SWI/SNF-related matrix-associated actin-dependent regulator 1 of chromatin subfamily A
MGLGKSIQICGLLNHCPEIRSVLIVCPASLKINWARELGRWLCDKIPRSILIVGDTQKKKPVEKSDDIVIVNYDLLALRHEYLRREWDLVVFDEGHYLKNREARRTQFAKELAQTSRRKVILTGTPLLNQPWELWSLLNLLEPGRWQSFYRFAHRYCDPVKTQWGWDFSGASNQEELSLLLRERYMLRRRKKDVLPQLPQVTCQIIPLTVEHAD